MNELGITSEYFEWLLDSIDHGRYSNVSYKKLLNTLHRIDFNPITPMDDNRAEDGKALRYHFSLAKDYNYDRIEPYLDDECSILEMMVALANRCEDIMDDPNMGDRTGQWFWGMINSLGLGGMTDYNYDEYFVERTIDIFQSRQYEPNGKGGLFTIKNCETDLRSIEIWHQACWYLDSIMGY